MKKQFGIRIEEELIECAKKLAEKNNEPVEYLKVSQKLPITLKSLRKRVN